MGEPSLSEVTRVLTAPGALFELESRDVSGRRVRCWKHFPSTLDGLVRGSLQHADKTYLVYEDERLTYTETFAHAAALSQALLERGVTHGTRVAIAMRNLPEWVIAFWAASCAGAVVVPLNAWWKGGELAYGLADSGAHVLICDFERACTLAAHLGETKIEHTIVARATEALAARTGGLEVPIAAQGGARGAPRDVAQSEYPPH